MDLERFQIYENNGKKGIVDVKLNKVVLESRFDVESFENEKITLKNGESFSLRSLLESCDYVTSKMRYFLVEDDETKLMGVYDASLGKLVVFCNCSKIEYLHKEKCFLVEKKGVVKKLPYQKLQYLKWRPLREEKILTLNNLSMYYGKQIKVNSKTGKKVEISR